MTEQGETLSYEEFLMTKAAWYYYKQDMIQQDIADLLGISRMRVIKLLDKARALGIIQFHFRADSAKRLSNEQKLMTLGALKDCFVVPAPDDSDDINENVAKAAAMYVANRIDGESFINIGYGDTANRVLNNLALVAEETISCVSLTGGVSPYLPNAQSAIFNSRLYLIPAPLILSSKETADAIRAEKAIRDIQALIPLSSLSVIGIGAMNEGATVLTSGVLTANDFLVLKRNGAVGDILNHFINENGELVSSELEERSISTDLDTIRSLPNVIGVAAGAEKLQAIEAALRGGYLDVLITDEPTAERIVARSGL